VTKGTKTTRRDPKLKAQLTNSQEQVKAAKAAAEVARKNAVKSTAQIKRDTKALLAKAGRSIREVRHDVSILKQAGIVSKRINAASYRPTKYILNKIKKNADILRGEVVAVKAPKAVRDLYSEKGVFEQRGSVLIVPKESAKQKTRIARGLVEVQRPLGNGEETRVILPYKLTDMAALATRLETDPTLDGLKRPDDLFGFRLYGHNMQTFGFPDAQELGEYIKHRYAHLFKAQAGRNAIKHFILFRFRSDRSTMNESDLPKTLHPKRPRPIDGYLRELKRDKDKKKKARARAKETPETRDKRLAEQRLRSARNRRGESLRDK
jgi:hypothetical protein